MTDCMEFLEVKREHSEVFEKSWAMHEKQGADLKDAANEEPDNGNTSRNNETKGKPQGKASSKPSPRAQVHAKPSLKKNTYWRKATQGPPREVQQDQGEDQHNLGSSTRASFPDRVWHGVV